VQGTWILSNFSWVVGDLFYPDDRVCSLMDFECKGDRYQIWSNVLSTVTPNCNSSLLLLLLVLLPSHQVTGRFRLASSWLCIVCIVELLTLLFLLLWQRRRRSWLLL
jgi:hypothetical protein